MDQSGNDSSSARKRQKVGEVDPGYSRKGLHGSSSGLTRRDSYGSNGMGGYGYQRDVSYEGDRRYDGAQSYAQNGWYDGYSQDDQYGAAWADSERAYEGYGDDDMYHNNAESAHTRSYLGVERYSYDGYYNANDTDVAMGDYYRTNEYADRYAYSYSGYHDSYNDGVGGNYNGTDRESMGTGQFGVRSNRFGLSSPFRGGSAGTASNASASAGGRYANTFKARQYSFGTRKVTRSTENVSSSSKTSVVKTGTEGSSDKKEKQKEPEKPRVITDNTVKDYLALRTTMLDFHLMTALLKLSLRPDLDLRKTLLEQKLAAQERERKDQEAKLEQERKAQEEKQEKERKEQEEKLELERREQRKLQQAQREEERKQLQAQREEQRKQLQAQREEQRKLLQVQREEERKKQQASLENQRKASSSQPATQSGAVEAVHSVTPEKSADHTVSSNVREGAMSKTASVSKEHSQRPASTSKERPVQSESSTKDRPPRSESATKDRPTRSESATKDRSPRSESASKGRAAQTASQEPLVRSGSAARYPAPAAANGRNHTTPKTVSDARAGDAATSATSLSRTERVRDPRERSVPRGRPSQPAGYTRETSAGAVSASRVAPRDHWDRSAREGYDYPAVAYGYEGYGDNYAAYDERYAYDAYSAPLGYDDRGYGYGYEDYHAQDAGYGAAGYGEGYGDYGRGGGYEQPYNGGGDVYYSGSMRGEVRREPGLSRQSSSGALGRGDRAARDSARAPSSTTAVNSTVPMRRATSHSLLAKPGDDHREAGEADEDTQPAVPVSVLPRHSSYSRDERSHRHTTSKASNDGAFLRTPR